MAHSSTSPNKSNLPWWREVPGEEYIVKLNSSNYESEIIHSGRPAFVMFYAQWCGFSVAARQAFASAAEQLANEGNPILLGAVDADQSKEICARYREVIGYPCFLFFSKGIPKLQYLNQRTREGFHDWILQNQHA